MDVSETGGTVRARWHYGAIRDGGHRRHRHSQSEKKKWRHAYRLLETSNLKEETMKHDA
jgi:hypothetical protein